MLKTLLSDYEVTTAGTCAEALQVAKTRLINLYLLDNWLPDGSGIELCKQIRKIDPNTPIIFYSAAAYDKDREEAIEAGAKVYLIKPVDISRLVEAIKTLMFQAELLGLEAKMAEIDAIQDNLKDRNQMIEEKLADINIRMLRLQARQAFIKAGGNRANFERLWTKVWKAEIQKSPQI
jgi:DNA-binding response OmpR family regulator